MRITALVKSHEHVCCRYRIAAFRACLESLGHRLDIRPWSSPWFVRQMLLPSFLNDMDVLIVQRKLFPAWKLNLLRRRVRWLIYDFDDSIFLRSSYNPRGPECSKRLQQFRSMVQCADVVVAGNEFLRDQATAFADPSRVRLIPTCVDASRYPIAPHASTRPRVKLAWIGSSSTLRGLEIIRPLLERLGKRFPLVELKIICDRSLTFEHLPVEFRSWSESTETAELADADIGISWLPDDGWSAGKCGLKVLQYMASGLPVVANPVGTQMQMVRPGETGYLAQTPDEWEQAIGQLVSDTVLRRQLGSNGRRLVETQFQVSRAASAWESVLQSLGLPVGISQKVS